MKILASNWKNCWLASVLLFSVWSPAMASWCTSASPTATMNINLGTVSESTANPVPVGSAIYAVSGAWDTYGGHNAGWCKSSQTANNRIKAYVRFSMPGAPVPGFRNVYPTNLTGVGVRISIWTYRSYYGTPTSTTPLPLTIIANLQNEPIDSSPAYGTGYLHVSVEVIKTAPNWQAGALRFVGGELRVSAADGASNTVTLTQVSIMGTMNTRSCSVAADSRNVSVNMREVAYPNGFSGREAGAYGPTIPFRISMNCASGPRTSIRFDPVTTLAGKPNIIGLTSDPSNASGVGVQLLNSNGVPLELRTPVLLTARAPDGASIYRFGGRYILTGEPVRGGRANAASVFTMVYE
ncbi:fimbrial protein [Cupriavidus sp. HMR-1]|uniref:fimbrial protein n=1 Tax=Cupriavidus sp. HMR-1 TaxID=1249621 RepID=UPI001F49B9DA|nr:fimbrial protein [Cupriavidus sp. HMR-1]